MWAFAAEAQTTRFETVSSAQGLSSDKVFCILQDRNGFLWIGTRDGLNRYDGYESKIYRQDTDDPESLPANDVMSLYEDRAGVLWVGTAGGLSRYDPQRDGFQRYVHDPENPQSISGNAVFSMFEDADGQFWISTWNNGLNRMDREKGTFESFYPDPAFPGKANKSFGSMIGADRRNGRAFWIGLQTETFKFYHFDTQRKTFTAYQPDAPLVGQHIWSIYEDKRGIVWVGTGAGLLFFDRDKGVFFRPGAEMGALPAELRSEFVPRIFEDRAGKIWICTKTKGLYEYDPATLQYNHYRHDPTDRESLADDGLMWLTQDRSGLLWIATDNRGAQCLIREKSRFGHIRFPDGLPNTFGVSGLCQDHSGTMWAGATSHKNGLYELDWAQKQFRLATLTGNTFADKNRWGVLSILEDRDRSLWLGGNGVGLCRVAADRKSVTLFKNDPANPASLAANTVTCLLEDRAGRLWVGTVAGLDLIDKNTNTFTHFNADPKRTGSLPGDFINTVFEDRQGSIWIGTDAGIARMNPAKTGDFQSFLGADPAKKGNPGSDVLSFYEDRAGRLWLSTATGLLKLAFPSPESQPEVTRYSQKDGLPNSNVCNVVEDGQGRLWIATQNGLSVFKNPGHDARTAPEFKNYPELGVECSFLSKTWFKQPGGELLLGEFNGLLFFHPDSIRDNPHVPPVVFTAFERYDTRYPERGAIEEKGIASRSEIRLSHTNNLLTIRFAALDFRDPKSNRYAYQLEGFNDNWIPLGNQRQLTFTNLDPGSYTLRVRGSNNDGTWNETGAVLKIVITPPWWQTAWAYAAYLLLAAAAVFGVVKARVRYLEGRTRELEAAVVKGTAQIVAQKEQLQAQAGQLQELDRLKSRFYTNITHEFRTPLTVVLGMTDQAETHFKTRQDGKFYLATEMIRRNGRHLLQLINQLLDLSKLEAGTLRLHLVHDDVAGFIGYLLQSLQSYAETKNIQLHFKPDPAAFAMDFDREKMQSIVANLVSNAIKFTPENGWVRVSTAVDGERLTIRVQDNGIGIPADKLPHVFDRFFQADDSHTRRGEGSGIGLALVRELVRLMGGEVSVDSTPGQGSEFTVTLPVAHTAAREEEPYAPALPVLIHADPKAPAAVPTEESDPSLPLVLVVEDNPDVAHYLQTCLSADYQVVLATDGQEGIERALELVPDLIVSDVMMPEKDGFELCETLKNEERTSHVPIVLLTAKADVASRIEGLVRGADAYLAKPFHRQELLVQLQRLILLRRQLQARYASFAPLPHTDDPDVRVEDAFLMKVWDVVAPHLSDETFGINELATAIYLSPSQLFRKVKALTGQSPALYLRSLRLRRGLELLKNSDLSVAEVAYQVGFSDPAYFSRTFSQEFGFAPKESRK